MTYWKINPKKEYTDKIQALGQELAVLREGDPQKNKAVFNAKWFELYQVSLRVFCKYVCEDDADGTAQDGQESGYVYINEKRVPDEVQEAFAKVMDEVVRLYDYEKEPNLFKFMNSRFKLRYQTLLEGQTFTLADYDSSDGNNEDEATDKKDTDKKAKGKVESLDALTYTQKDKEGEKSRPDAYTPSTTDDIDQLEAEYLLDGIFLDLAAEIISMTSKVKLTSRVNYYRLFYTSQLISFLKVRNSKPYFQHESKVYNSLKKAFIDYCVEQQCETLEQIQAASLRWLRDVVDRVVEPNIRIPIPIEQEVELTYMNRNEMKKPIAQQTLKEQKSYYNKMFKEIRSRM